MDEETAGTARASPGEGLAELRRLLVGPEQAQIEGLRKRLETRGLFAESVSDVLADAIRLRAALDGSLRSSLDPIIQDVIRISVRRDPAILADALFPVIGKAVRRAVAAALRGMMESLNQLLEQSLSWRSLSWRLEAFRTGKSFGEVLLIRSLLYRVEQVFLIHRKTGLLLQHRAAEARVIQDADLVSGMLTAIQDFVSDSFGAQPGQELETVQVGDFTIWIQHGPQAVLAGVVRGPAPKRLQNVFQSALEAICREQAPDLEQFDGDASPFQNSARHLDACLLGQLPPRKRRPRLLLWAFAGIPAAAAVVWLGMWYREHRNWNLYLEALNREPGIVVTSAGKRGGGYYVSGLRDPLAADPAALLARAGLAPARLHGRWEPYYSLEPRFAAARQLERQRVTVERQLVHFAVNSSDLSAAQIGAIADIALDIRSLLEAARIAGAHVRIEVIGHTDNSGSETRNTRLAHLRAGAVISALADAGLSRDGLSARGAGSSEPVRRGDSALDRELNRSVSFRVFVEK